MTSGLHLNVSLHVSQHLDWELDLLDDMRGGVWDVVALSEDHLPIGWILT